MEPRPTASPLEDWNRLRDICATLPSARELRRHKGPVGRTIRIRCDRSIPYEFVGEFLNPFLAAWGANESTEISDYDPALAQLESAREHDVRILFVDWRLSTSRLSPAEAANWIGERARTALRLAPRAPVLVNGWPICDGAAWIGALNAEVRRLEVPGLYLIDLENVRREVPGSFFDARNDATSRFPFSSAAAVAIARHIALDLLPSLVGERIKGLVLDLDDTLWGGVLGEDGPERVPIGPGHIALHQMLKELRTRGVLLTVCSRNDPADVEAIFRLRPDLVLESSDFASIHASWEPKATSILAIARDLNVHPSTLLFVDDNPSELAKAQDAVDGLRVLLADPQGALTAQALQHYPGLFAVSEDAAAALRTEDIRKNRERERLKSETGDRRTYLSALRMEVDLHRSNAAHAARVFELSNKTNQFNLALKRLSRAQAEEAFEQDHLTMTVHSRDALSDSGLVGVFIARRDGELAIVREVLFSCRVLGREIETLALAHFARWLAEWGTRIVRFEVVEGPRNQPARSWLSRVMPQGAVDELAALIARLEDARRNHPAAVREFRWN